MQASLEEKQAYLRDNIEQDQYDDFCEFCENELQNIDISSWTVDQVKTIVGKFKEQQLQEQLKESQNPHEQSYYDYQSATGQDNQQPIRDNGQILQQIKEGNEHSEAQTSRVDKSSAVDLLDEVFEKTSVKTATERNNNQPTSSAVSFDEFDFWASTITTNPNQINPQNQEGKFQTSSLKIQPNQNQQARKYNSPNHAGTYAQNRATSPDESRKAASNHLPPQTAPPKRNTPYSKKQKPEHPIEISAAKHIQIKQIKPLDEPKHQKWLVEQKKFEQQLVCLRSVIRDQLSDKNINVLIDKHEIIERNFLAADYAMFQLKLTPMNTECRRNHDDFTKLKENLGKFFPGFHVPYLSDNSWFNHTNVEFINTQKKMLQFFLRDLLRNKQFRNSRIVEDFLTIKDHKPMKRKFQRYSKLEKLKGIEELCLLEGKVKTSLSTEQKNYNENMKKLIDKMDGLFQKFTKLCSNITYHYSDLMNSFKNLSGLMADMQKQVKSFNSKVTHNQIKNLGSVFRVLRETFKEDMSNAKFQNDLYIKKVIPFIKYEHANFKELNKLIDINHRFQKAYEKRSQYETINIRDSYNSDQSKNMKKGILEESKSLIVLKYQTGYLGRQVTTESQRVFDEMGVKMFNRWQLLSEYYQDKLTKNMDFWKSLAKIDASKYATEVTF